MKKTLYIAMALIMLLTGCTVYASPAEKWCDTLDKITNETSGSFLEVITIDTEALGLSELGAVLPSQSITLTGKFDLAAKKLEATISDEVAVLASIVIDDNSLYLCSDSLIDGLISSAEYLEIDLSDILSESEIDGMWNKKSNPFTNGVYEEFKKIVKSSEYVTENSDSRYVLAVDKTQMLNIIEGILVYIEDNLDSFAPLINKTFSWEYETNEDILVAFSEMLEKLEDSPDFSFTMSVGNNGTYAVDAELTLADKNVFVSSTKFIPEAVFIETPQNSLSSNSLFPNIISGADNIDINSPDFSFSLDVPDDLDSFFSI